MASNAWVIHGNHTKSGMPLLASDPHLKNSLPCIWMLNELRWGDRFAVGGTIVGTPSIAVGRTNNFAWGLTTSRIDNIDLWEEEINDDFTKYKVDGEWRQIKKVTESIKVRGGKTIEFEVGFTHRGPIFSLDLM